MDVYLTKQAQKWAKGNGVTSTALKDAATEVAAGQNDGDRVVYIFGYDKSEMGVVPKKALKAFKDAAKVWKAMTDEEMKKAVDDGQVKKI